MTNFCKTSLIDIFKVVVDVADSLYPFYSAESLVGRKLSTFLETNLFPLQCYKGLGVWL